METYGVGPIQWDSLFDIFASPRNYICYKGLLITLDFRNNLQLAPSVAS